MSTPKRRTVLAVGLAILSVSLVRTAWLSDDAYISFRTADNILNGYGAVWNVGERVQVFTHPLWLALCTLAFRLTGEVYYSAILLSVILTLAWVTLLMTRLASTPSTMILCFAVLLSSKALIDFSTSGLENPLSHFLLVVFIWQLWSGAETPVGFRRLCAMASLCVLTRMDLALIVAPPVMFAAWRLGLRLAIRPLVIGILPWVAWEFFSIFYYGTPFPNTAYAKLTVHMSTGVRLQRGVDYALRTLTADPVTLPAITACVFAAVRAQRSSDWSLVAGITAYCGYVLWIGGDFMMGRFFTAPLIVSLALFAKADWPLRTKTAVLAATPVLALGLLAPWEPALLSGYGYAYSVNILRGHPRGAPEVGERYLFVQQITDERRYYYEAAGLLKVVARGELEHEWRTEGLQLRAGGRQVVVRPSIGFVGYYSGPRVHVVDLCALGDPLLARIPGGADSSVMGHFLRSVPDGYVDTIATGTNQLGDSDLAAYYDRLHLITAGPLWSEQRLLTLASFLAGRYDPYLKAYLDRAP